MRSTFKEWNLDKIEEAFGLKQVWQSEILDELINHPYQLDEMERTFVTKLQRHFSFGGDDWNEVELENKFISPMIVLSEIADEKCSYFLERELSTTIDEYELSGKVDGMIATGFRSPKKPHFCLNEYKRGTDPDGDPKGQALIAMLVAQRLNDNQAPIFGCFVIGRIEVRHREFLCALPILDHHVNVIHGWSHCFYSGCRLIARHNHQCHSHPCNGCINSLCAHTLVGFWVEV